MRTYELLEFNKELLEKLHVSGIKPDDYKYAGLYGEYEHLKKQGEKVTYIVSYLAEKHGICERQVYLVIDRLGRNIGCKDVSVG
ncbi:hypothetical protein Barb6_01981 [Bacteroidales bacterium Barb6]|nr:hypothetical protein Barb6_01981 [Bacteroidales bacterium Barb6]